MKLSVVFVVCFSIVFCEAFHAPRALTRKRYDGYKVLSITPENRESLDFLHHLMVSDIHVDFWQEPSNVGAEVHLMVSPQHRENVEQQLRELGMNVKTHIDDVQSQLTPMWNSIDRRELEAGQLAFDIDDFNTVDDIYAWMETLVAQCRDGLTCEVYSLGDSYEGRPINVFRISKTGTGRKAYWVDATIHAREWIATATILKILNTMATGGSDEAIRLTEDYDWYFLPVMNPDGYAYTWDSDRLWRKNRRPSGAACYGVDLNRNFDFRWGNDGVSHVPCADTYCGESGGSEPETQAVQAELVRLGPTLGATVTIHSYGNMWMFPWGNTVDYNGQTCDLAADHAEMMVVADATANAIEATYNTQWSRGNSCVVIYATTGGTDDYAKGVAGVKYAFCPELRGSSFVISASQIELSFQEVFNGLVVMCDTINA
jgi:carboxypeptidase A2